MPPKTSAALLAWAKKNKIEVVDLKFVDLFGRWHHISLPASRLGPELFTRGIAFDGSSVPGFKKLEAGELLGIDTDMVGPYSYSCDFSRTWLCKPGTPTAEFEVGDTVLLESDPAGAHVTSVWLENDAQHEGISYEIVWVKTINISQVWEYLSK